MDEKIKEIIEADSNWGQLYPDQKFLIRQTAVEKRIVPSIDDSAVDRNSYAARRIYTKYCSWCLVADEWISEIAKLLEGKKVIEVMAGKGLISYALQKHGVDIQAYDNYSWNVNIPCTYTDVHNLDLVSAVREVPDLDYVIMSWPPYDMDLTNFLRVMIYKQPKAKIIYIGEWLYGCNADDRFFNNVISIEDGKDYKYIMNANHHFSSWYGIHDAIWLLRPNQKLVRKKKRRGILK